MFGSLEPLGLNESRTGSLLCHGPAVYVEK